ncbi:hypothetical protein MTO96_002115 [Rhipicephalus appendiculatus]
MLLRCGWALFLRLDFAFLSQPFHCIPGEWRVARRSMFPESGDFSRLHRIPRVLRNARKLFRAEQASKPRPRAKPYSLSQPRWFRSSLRARRGTALQQYGTAERKLRTALAKPESRTDSESVHD